MIHINGKAKRSLRASAVVLTAFVFAGITWADGGANHRVRNQHFGVSGGNINDISKAFCCSGTLGSLVTDGTTQYILSNNHVLARGDQAAPGEDVSQPGLIDNGCRVTTVVADFTVAPKLGSNVDAAIAQLRSGMMDSTGSIEDIGTISSVVKPPTIGLAVEKSGRTTGLTTGSIGSINASVNVQYQKGCGSGKKFVVSYTNQIVINGSSFSAGGDSGSLIVANDSCHQPVGLLYAGSSTSTIANPVGEVLDKFVGLGKSLSFVGNTCSTAAPATATPSEALVNYATEVVREQGPELMARGQVIGVGVSAADENPYEAVLVLYIDRTAGVVPDLPDQVRGVRVKRVFTDPFIALPSCGSCSNCK